MELTYVLNEILKKEKKNSKESPQEVSAVFVSILTSDGYLRCIPWSEDNSIFDHINLLANGFLKDVELVELAKNLIELKYHEPDTFKNIYQSIQENTNFNNYEELEETMKEIEKDLELDEEASSEPSDMVC